ncbi:MAG: hypothetical protein OWS03_06970, partial [Alicyclobacillaceae bacterium]|nr:hypothetical protein [Alicyclobacillaceae bacterium]
DLHIERVDGLIQSHLIAGTASASGHQNAQAAAWLFSEDVAKIGGCGLRDRPVWCVHVGISPFC